MFLFTTIPQHPAYSQPIKDLTKLNTEEKDVQHTAVNDLLILTGYLDDEGGLSWDLEFHNMNSRRTTRKFERSIINKERNHFSTVKLSEEPETTCVRPLSNGAV
ncbi:hypothetical protein AVEN_20434-1 [Araneus ventricosus]|uniref:Uncharacterized protein n=1 Tax=Araneus ventricosus TaxID=182803 RepID=A0A4Y2NN13_ARAVE|nr:hypothetical protein AVEN_20434-1 [Araneus ventricosus]